MNKGRQFYACPKGREAGCKYFKWIDDPQSDAIPGPSQFIPATGNSNLMGTSAGGCPSCDCGAPAVMKKVLKESANKGRQFYVCYKGQGAGCNFFKWADDSFVPGPPVGQTYYTPSDDVSAQGFSSQRNPNLASSDFGGQQEACPPCQCGTPAVLKRVLKESANKGRQFYVCPKGQGMGCNFFKWADELGVSIHSISPTSCDGSVTVSPTKNMNCNCGIPATIRTVQKEGVNKGRKFFNCSRQTGADCGFFKWGDESR